MRKVKETDIIYFNNNNCFLIRENELYETQYHRVEVGETYCVITQTPSTPADFGLASAIKKDPKEVSDKVFIDKIDDEFIKGVDDFTIINPKGIKEFILRPEDFKSYYE